MTYFYLVFTEFGINDIYILYLILSDSFGSVFQRIKSRFLNAYPLITSIHKLARKKL